MRRQTTTVTLHGLGPPVVLELRRTPPLLRFVRKGGEWDALDLLDDEPDLGEEVLVAVRTGLSTAHVDGYEGRKRKAWWIRMADYTVCPEQPDGVTVRDTKLWREWAVTAYARLESGRRGE